MRFFACLLGWFVTWVLVFALIVLYIWLLDVVFGIDVAAMPRGSGRGALYAIGALFASFATINGVSEAIRRYRTRDEPEPEPVRGPSRDELRSLIVPTRADRIRKLAVIGIASLFLIGVGAVAVVAVWNALD